MKKVTQKKEVVVAVSGGFDPIHPGHIRLIHEAKKLGTKLVVILNNDNWLKKKKGKPFMSEKERKEVLEALRDVDKVVLTNHKPQASDMSVSATLAKIKPDVFANGGDRNKKNAADPTSSLYTDINTCKKIRCAMVFNVGKGGKIQSSSWLLANYAAQKKQR
ncbi:MAG: adenylyltransferase/cytidyltransferase family protein [Candidatus Doudnabacteria bacterium]|nr:adenylyltransferase/cytidyltransferase family protein [Candidatus Doudnabacteria bacterium]